MRFQTIMLGTRLGARGGISSVVETYADNNLFERWGIYYINTHVDGSIWNKLYILAKAMIEFIKIISFQRINLVHAHTASRFSFFRKSIFFLMCRTFKIPYIIHLHGAEFIEFYQKESPKWMKGYILKTFKNAEAIVVLSESWEKKILGIFGNLNVRVVSNPVRFPNVVPARRKGSTIVFSGRMNRRKGIFDLISAFEIVSHRFPEARLLCCGDGDLDLVRSLVKRSGLSNSISILGWIGRDQMCQILAESDVFVLTSYDEGLPMSLLEAMSASLAVVTTPVGGIPDVIQNHINGILVPPGDVEAISQALISLLGSEVLRLKLAASALQVVSDKFSTSKSLEKLEGVYADLGLQLYN